MLTPPTCSLVKEDCYGAMLIAGHTYIPSWPLKACEMEASREYSNILRRDDEPAARTRESTGSGNDYPQV